MLQRKHRLAILLSVCACAVIGVMALSPIAQSADYHRFADGREMAGIPNFWNVASNAMFLWVGAVGLFEVLRGRYRGGLASLRAAYAIFFAGVAAVCFGSGYYHWSPSNQTLVWDRLPMAIAF